MYYIGMQPQQLGPAAWETARLGTTRLACGRSLCDCRQAGQEAQNSVGCPLMEIFETPLAGSHVPLAIACGECCIARRHAVAVHTSRSCRARSGAASCLSAPVASKLQCTSACQQTQASRSNSLAPPCFLQESRVANSNAVTSPNGLGISHLCLAAISPMQRFVHHCTPGWLDLPADFPCPAPAGPPAQAAAKLHQPPPRVPRAGLPPRARATHSDCASRGSLEDGLENS